MPINVKPMIDQSLPYAWATTARQARDIDHRDRLMDGISTTRGRYQP